MSDSADAIQRRMKRVLDIMANDVVAMATQNLIDNGTPDTGYLMSEASLHVVYVDENTRRVECMAPYSGAIEFGTEPHPISPKVLKNWARRKLGDERAAYAVAKKIEREGTDPQPFFRPAITKANLKLQDGTYVRAAILEEGTTNA